MFLTPRRKSRLTIAFILCALYLLLPFPKFFGSSPILLHHVSEWYPSRVGLTDIRPLEPETPTYPSPKEQKPLHIDPKLAHPRFRIDGLVEVNPKGPHPIYDIIAHAEEDWKVKQQKSSKTLPEAVKEYRRRYNREPPKGFDHWWSYVVKNNVKLPDEYDQIYVDLEPFWGLEPTDLLVIQAELEAEADVSSYVIEKTEKGPVTANLVLGDDDEFYARASALLELLKEVEEQLPPFRFVLSPHDSSKNLADFNTRNMLIDSANAQTYLSRHELPRSGRNGWATACPPNSPARQKPINLDLAVPRQSKKTFIYSHKLASNPCLHPSHLWLHGEYLSHPKGPKPPSTILPEFSFTSSHLQNSIRLPPPILDDEEAHYSASWEEKDDERLLWRGPNQGAPYAEHAKWRNSHQARFVTEANSMDGTVDLLLPNGKNEPVIFWYMGRDVLSSSLDLSFFGAPQHCTPAVCRDLAINYPWDALPFSEYESTHKYVLDMDGDETSMRFKRLMSSNSLVFKATTYPDWFVDRIQPWLHYVPVQLDLSDLHDTLIFFRGNTNGDGANEDFAKKIAMSGKQWSETYLRREDLVAYMYRLILEYGRLMSPDRKAMSYTEKRSV